MKGEIIIDKLQINKIHDTVQIVLRLEFEQFIEIKSSNSVTNLEPKNKSGELSVETA